MVVLKNRFTPKPWLSINRKDLSLTYKRIMLLMRYSPQLISDWIQFCAQQYGFVYPENFKQKNLSDPFLSISSDTLDQKKSFSEASSAVSLEEMYVDHYSQENLPIPESLFFLEQWFEVDRSSDNVSNGEGPIKFFNVWHKIASALVKGANFSQAIRSVGVGDGMEKETYQSSYELFYKRCFCDERLRALPCVRDPRKILKQSKIDYPEYSKEIEHCFTSLNKIRSQWNELYKLKRQYTYKQFRQVCREGGFQLSGFLQESVPLIVMECCLDIVFPFSSGKKTLRLSDKPNGQTSSALLSVDPQILDVAYTDLSKCNSALSQVCSVRARKNLTIISNCLVSFGRDQGSNKPSTLKIFRVANSLLISCFRKTEQFFSLEVDVKNKFTELFRYKQFSEKELKYIFPLVRVLIRDILPLTDPCG